MIDWAFVAASHWVKLDVTQLLALRKSVLLTAGAMKLEPRKLPRSPRRSLPDRP